MCSQGILRMTSAEQEKSREDHQENSNMENPINCFTTGKKHFRCSFILIGISNNIYVYYNSHAFPVLLKYRNVFCLLDDEEDSTVNVGASTSGANQLGKNDSINKTYQDNGRQ